MIKVTFANGENIIAKRAEFSDTHVRLWNENDGQHTVARDQIAGIEDAPLPVTEPAVSRILDAMARMPGTDDERARYLHLCRHANNLASFFLDVAQDGFDLALAGHRVSASVASHTIYNWIEAHILEL